MNSGISISSTIWAVRFGRWARLLPRLAMALFLGFNPELRAQDAVPFTYVTNQNAITNTGYSGPGGAVTIPAKLNGLPVTRIGDYASFNRASLTQITLPNSLTTLGEGVFSGCTGLTTIDVAGANPNYRSVGGVLFDKGQTVILKYPGGRPGTYRLPDGSFGFPVDWAPHRQVTVEACDDLAQPDWQPVGSLTLDATGAAQFTDPTAASHPNRLYRLRTP